MLLEILFLVLVMVEFFLVLSSHFLIVNSCLGLWILALGCSLLVSMASLICLIILPVMFGKCFNCQHIVSRVHDFGSLEASIL